MRICTLPLGSGSNEIAAYQVCMMLWVVIGLEFAVAVAVLLLVGCSRRLRGVVLLARDDCVSTRAYLYKRITSTRV